MTDTDRFKELEEKITTLSFLLDLEQRERQALELDFRRFLCRRYHEAEIEREATRLLGKERYGHPRIPREWAKDEA
jgi:hypothetical protein